MHRLVPVFLLSVLLAAPLSAQAQITSANAETPFAEEFLQDGQPVLASGMELRLDIADPRYAPIRADGVVPSLFLLSHKKEDDGRTYSLISGRPSGGFTYQQVVLGAGEGEEQRGTASLSVTDTTEALVELRVLPEGDLLRYRWFGSSNESAATAGGTPVLQSSSMVQVGRLMPNFFAETMSGERISLEDFRGKTVIINWWATTCAPCIVEMPGLNELVQKYESRDDIIFLAVASNTEQELKRFFRKYDFAYRQTTGNDRTTKIFGAAFPRNVVVDAEGTVIYDKVGANENQHEKIEAALQEHVVN